VYKSNQCIPTVNTEINCYGCIKQFFAHLRNNHLYQEQLTPWSCSDFKLFYIVYIHSNNYRRKQSHGPFTSMSTEVRNYHIQLHTIHWRKFPKIYRVFQSLTKSMEYNPWDANSQTRIPSLLLKPNVHYCVKKSSSLDIQVTTVVDNDTDIDR
jgi:hypothetical protein